MGPKTFINVIGTRCHPDDDAKFNKWYDEVHIPMLMKFKGMKKVTRYKAAYLPKDYPTYLTIYEFASKADFEAYSNSPELAEARKEMAETWKERPFELTWRVQFEALKTWER